MQLFSARVRVVRHHSHGRSAAAGWRAPVHGCRDRAADCAGTGSPGRWRAGAAVRAEADRLGRIGACPASGSISRTTGPGFGRLGSQSARPADRPGRARRPLETVLRAPAKLVVAGRTDAGVHATGQVAHVDLEDAQLASLSRRKVPIPELVATRLNGIAGLKSDVVVRRSSIAPEGFDARSRPCGAATGTGSPTRAPCATPAAPRHPLVPGRPRHRRHARRRPGTARPARLGRLLPSS